MLKLRYYQREAIDSVFSYFAHASGNPVIACPTGTGKSIIIAGFLAEVYEYFPDQRIMMLTHVKELIDQNFKELMELWPTAPAGVYSAGLKRRDTHNRITFAGIQSVGKRAEEFKHIDLILIDECHLVSDRDATLYRKFIDALMQVNPHLKVIGLSATPYRLGLGMITEGGLFTDICYDNTNLQGFNRLVDEGFIIPLIPKKTTYELDISGVGKRGGEFIPKEVQEAVDQERVTYQALLETLELGHDREHWLVFGTGVQHCDNIAAMLQSLGIEAVSVHSKQSAEHNDKAILDFKSGKVKALVNNNKLTTGFNAPFIDMIVMLRPTDSPGLWVQMLGRGTRPVYASGFDLTILLQRLEAIAVSAKRDCLVLDFAGNTKRLGPINDPKIPKKKGSKGDGVAPIRLCTVQLSDGAICNTYNHAGARYCISCGTEFPRITKIFAESGTDALMASGLPQIDIFKVTKVTYAVHRKEGRPNSIKVSIWCGLTRYTTYVCLEHGGYAAKLAQDWWDARCPYPAPETTAEAIDYISNVATPLYIKVWTNKKHPEVLAYDFTSNAFKPPITEEE
jgi:DNA repair protein RadD